ncbi:MAG TPA: ABC transporter permease [Actinomycetes bacterium]|nr:ABC transporter permease [Actinomycetes bacterium]
MAEETKHKEKEGPTRVLWPTLAFPGTAWLIALFVIPFYGIMAVAFSSQLNSLRQPIPVWNPLHWNFAVFTKVIQESLGGFYQAAWVHTFVYTFFAMTICVLVGYPVAYYVARLAGRRRGLLLALILLPWWINYLTRMLAWVGLLDTNGYVNNILGIFGAPQVEWLGGRASVVIIGLAYGYLPFFIIPLYASLDRIDQRHIEASRDLGVGSVRTFFHVTLPLSRIGLITAMVITALPMFGDYYTNTLLSNSPTTTMVGNSIEKTLQSGFSRAQGASLVLLLSAVLLVFMAYYLIITQRASKEAAR